VFRLEKERNLPVQKILHRGGGKGSLPEKKGNLSRLGRAKRRGGKKFRKKAGGIGRPTGWGPAQRGERKKINRPREKRKGN